MEPYESRSLQKTSVYYRIDEPAELVYILNVIYNQRDQLIQMVKIKI